MGSHTKIWSTCMYCWHVYKFDTPNRHQFVKLLLEIKLFLMFFCWCKGELPLCIRALWLAFHWIDGNIWLVLSHHMVTKWSCDIVIFKLIVINQSISFRYRLLRLLPGGKYFSFIRMLFLCINLPSVSIWFDFILSVW